MTPQYQGHQKLHMQYCNVIPLQSSTVSMLDADIRTCQFFPSRGQFKPYRASIHWIAKQHGRHTGYGRSDYATHQRRCQCVLALPFQGSLLFLQAPRLLPAIGPASGSIDNYFDHSPRFIIRLYIPPSSCIPRALPRPSGLVQCCVLGPWGGPGCDRITVRSIARGRDVGRCL